MGTAPQTEHDARREAMRRAKCSHTALLGDHTASAGIDALVAALESGEGTARRRAREALVASGRPAVRSLTERLQYPNEGVRWAAAKALSEIEDKASAPALVAALQDRSFAVRWLAAEGLVALERHALPPLLRALVKQADSVRLREGALHVLHQLAKNGLGNETGPLVAALEGPAPALAAPLAATDAIDRLRGARRRRDALKRPRGRLRVRRLSGWSRHDNR